jgi:hypothetical protein
MSVDAGLQLFAGAYFVRFTRQTKTRARLSLRGSPQQSPTFGCRSEAVAWEPRMVPASAMYLVTTKMANGAPRQDSERWQWSS